MNSSYLPFGLEDWPTSLFSHVGAGLRQDMILSRVLNKKRFKAQLDENDFELLSWQPHLVGNLIMERQLTPYEQNTLFGRSFPLLFRVLVSRYELLAPYIEKRLYSDLESVERLVTYLHTENRQGQMDEKFYATLLDADPNRALRVIRDPDTHTFKRDLLVDGAGPMRCTSPAWAFFYMRAHKGETLPPELREVLKKSEEYSYLTARLLSERAVVSAEYADLVNNLTQPRWIYHALRDGLGGDTDEMLNKLLADPAWLVQYLTISGMQIEQKEEIYQRAVVYLANSPKRNACIRDLHVWYQAQTIQEVIAMHDASAEAA